MTTKPTVDADWATDGGAVKALPPQKTMGWILNEIPLVSHMNYMLNLIWLWLAWLRGGAEVPTLGEATGATVGETVTVYRKGAAGDREQFLTTANISSIVPAVVDGEFVHLIDVWGPVLRTYYQKDMTETAFSPRSIPTFSLVDVATDGMGWVYYTDPTTGSGNIVRGIKSDGSAGTRTYTFVGKVYKICSEGVNLFALTYWSGGDLHRIEAVRLSDGAGHITPRVIPQPANFASNMVCNKEVVAYGFNKFSGTIFAEVADAATGAVYKHSTSSVASTFVSPTASGSEDCKGVALTPNGELYIVTDDIPGFLYRALYRTTIPRLVTMPTGSTGSTEYRAVVTCGRYLSVLWNNTGNYYLATFLLGSGGLTQVYLEYYGTVNVQRLATDGDKLYIGSSGMAAEFDSATLRVLKVNTSPRKYIVRDSTYPGSGKYLPLGDY